METIGFIYDTDTNIVQYIVVSNNTDDYDVIYYGLVYDQETDTYSTSSEYITNNVVKNDLLESYTYVESEVTNDNIIKYINCTLMYNGTNLYCMNEMQ